MTAATHRTRERQALLRFGDRVRSRRIAMGLSQEGFAELAHLHRTYISGIERGERNISVLKVVQIADALKIDPGALVRDLCLDEPEGLEGRDRHGGGARSGRRT